MRLAYSLGLGLVLASLVGAQTPVNPTNPQPTTGRQVPEGKAVPVQTLPPPLFQMSDVNKALQLNQEQINRLNGVTEKVRKQYAPQLEKLATLSEADRFARVQELNRLYSADWAKSAADIFTDQQRLRYLQLTQQYGGFSTLMDPEVQKRLNLTPEQVGSLRDHLQWSQRQIGTINTLGATNSTKGTQQYEMYRKQYLDRFNKLLNAEQQKAWREMTGEPYSFQPNFTKDR
jgi:hypothetical protein